MGNTGSVGVIERLETFMVDDINTAAGNGIGWVTAVAGGATAFVRASSAAAGIHCLGVISAADNDLLELCGDEIFVYGQTGYNMIEVLFQANVVTALAFNIGFNDDSLEASPLPIELSGTTWTTNATDAIMLVLDMDATNYEVHCMWVDDGNDTSEAIADLRMRGASLQADKWAMARLELQDRGSGNGLRATFTFAQDGKSFQKEFNTSLDRDIALVPYIGFESRVATASNIRIKYIKQAQSIAD